jgi:hypothetical protein
MPSFEASASGYVPVPKLHGSCHLEFEHRQVRMKGVILNIRPVYV